MIPAYWHHNDLGGHGITIKIMYDGERIPPNMIRLYKMDVIPRIVLKMCGSSHLTIPYLLKGEQGGLRD